MTTAAVEDVRLVEAARAGDGGAAFRAIVERYAPRIASYLTRMLGSDAAVADITQETFLRAYRHLNRYDPRWSLSTWLFGIAANQARDHLRRSSHRRAEPLPLALPDQAEAPVDRAALEERVGRVRRALGELPDGQREVVLLHVYEQLSYAEVGRALGIPEATARSRMRYALAKLGGLLEEPSND